MGSMAWKKEMATGIQTFRQISYCTDINFSKSTFIVQVTLKEISPPKVQDRIFPLRLYFIYTIAYEKVMIKTK